MNLENRQLIVIGGCPRSGTTALTDLLNLDKRLFIAREFRVFRCWKHPIGGLLLKHKFIEGRGSRRVFDYHNLNCEELIQPTTNGKKLARFVLSNTSGIEWFGDKLPRFYLYFARGLIRKYPNMKFIFCLRDGRAVIASQMRLFRSGKSKASFTAGSIPGCEYLWLEGIQKLEMNLSCSRLRDRMMIVRYEEAVTNPEKVANQVGKFLGVGDLDVSGHWYEAVHLDSWRTELPNMEDRISNKFKKKLKEWGYG